MGETAECFSGTGTISLLLATSSLATLSLSWKFSGGDIVEVSGRGKGCSQKGVMGRGEGVRESRGGVRGGIEEV